MKLEIVLGILFVVCFMIVFTRRNVEDFVSVSWNKNLPFEKYNYWWKMKPFFTQGEPMPSGPMPVNQRLF